MNCLAWNCRGFGNLRTGKELIEIIQAKDPSIVFIAETWTDEARLDRVQQEIEFENKWVVSSNNRGGGLVLFWKASVNLTMEGSSKYYIDSYIDKNTENALRFTGFYGGPEMAKRWEAWNDLCSLINHSEIPWICVRDFNEVTKQCEKLGGALRNHN